jgi:hypothetical protein
MEKSETFVEALLEKVLISISVVIIRSDYNKLSVDNPYETKYQ